MQFTEIKPGAKRTLVLGGEVPSPASSEEGRRVAVPDQFRDLVDEELERWNPNERNDAENRRRRPRGKSIGVYVFPVWRKASWTAVVPYRSFRVESSNEAGPWKR